MKKETIITAVCNYFNTTFDEVMENRTSRSPNNVLIRQFIFKMLKENTRLSTPQIGAQICKDHATVLHSLKTIQNRIETEPETKKHYENIKQNLKYYEFDYTSIANY